MGLIVRTHSVHSTHRVAARVRLIAADAARLVADNVGQLPHVEIVVTSQVGMHRLADLAEARVAGGGQPSKQVEARYGRASLAPRGVLLGINAHAHDNQHELDTTLIHELVHGVQLNRPGARARHIVYLRNNYGIEEVSDAAAHKANAQIRADEDEARSLEALALKLNKEDR